MAEINLLQTNQNQGGGITPTNLLNQVGIVLLVLVIGGYAILFLRTNSLNANTVNADSEKLLLEQQLQADPQYPALISYQNKLHNTQLLLAKHLKWSMVLGKFSEATLKTAKFDKFVANYDGTANISGFVPDFASLDQQMKAYQLNEFQYIKDVKLINVGLSSKERIGIDFTLKIDFNTDLLKNVPLK